MWSRIEPTPNLLTVASDRWTRARNWAAAGVSVVVIGVVLAGLLIGARIEASVTAADMTLAGVVAAAPERTDAAMGSGYRVELVAPAATRATVTAADAMERRWRAEVTSQSRGGSAFLTTDPDGVVWLHAPAAMKDGSHVVLSRRADDAFRPARNVRLGFAAVAILIGLLGVGNWRLTNRSNRTFRRLIDASEDLRWRGEVREEERARLVALGEQEDQFGRLARSLLATESDIKRRFLQLTSLLHSSRVVGSSLSTEEVFDNILGQVQALFEVERCAVVALDARADRFRIRASRGMSEAFTAALSIRPTESDSPTTRALRSGVPTQVADVDSDRTFAAFRDRARAEGYRSVLAIPLDTVHAQPAALILQKAEPHRYSFWELEVARSFGRFASAAMENAALFERVDYRLEEQTRRLEAIVGSLEDGLLLVGVDGGVHYCNEAAADAIGVGPRDVTRLTGVAYVERLAGFAADAEDARESLLALLDGTGVGEVDIVHAGNDRLRDVRISAFDVTDRRGRRTGRGLLSNDVTTAKELDRAKEALIAMVSHELRTPLATIKGYASTLLADDVDWDRTAQHEFLETISGETDRLTRLVADLLDVSRIQAGLEDLHTEDVTVATLFDQALGIAPGAVRSRAMVDLPVGLAVRVDVTRIVSVIRNLVENAAKYGDADQPIELEAERSGDRVVISVRDRGPGIPQSERARIFERFVQGAAVMTRAHGGVGVGLAICRGFVEAHRGTIRIESADPGTRFVFDVPAAPSRKVLIGAFAGARRELGATR
ncbi:MAG: ATP-binding protein [Acidimicrobiia bacterium]